jgi:mevalonate kinase
MTPKDTRTSVFETRARGKFLLTAEYFVLDGALALALPLRYGQTLHVEPGKEPNRLFWTSKNAGGVAWFLAEYELTELAPLSFTDKKTAALLAGILKECRRQNPDFLAENQSFKALTQNDFPREWGLGTSSTLIASVAKWAKADPYPVLFATFGGSGYDLACAYADGPILYRLEGRTPLLRAADFRPSFSENLFFVFLEKKQDSREGIACYRERAKGDAALVAEISQLTGRFLSAKNLSELDEVIREHEEIISRALGLPRAKDLYFSDFGGEVKSLGAWGGDFVLATSERSAAETQAYFQKKGFETTLTWKEMTGE